MTSKQYKVDMPDVSLVSLQLKGYIHPKIEKSSHYLLTPTLIESQG